MLTLQLDGPTLAEMIDALRSQGRRDLAVTLAGAVLRSPDLTRLETQQVRGYQDAARN